MDPVEVEGATIDEAIERALRDLGVPRSEVEIEILSNRTRGVFGLGAKPARVRASLRTRLTAIAESSESTDVVDGRAASAPSAMSPPIPPSRPTERDRSGQSEIEIGPDRAMVEKARPILQEIVDHMGIRATAEVCETVDGIGLGLTCDGSGILIGKQGQTLDALEYLVNRILSKEEESRRRITVDTEGYRVRRCSSLEQIAQRTAERVRASGRPITLDPMSPRDRRIIHLSLQHDERLHTRSTGDGYYRQVVVSLRRGRSAKGEVASAVR